MPIIAKDTKKVFAPAPSGVHSGACCDVVDLGLVTTPWGEKPQVELRFQLGKSDADGRRFLVLRRFTNTLSEKGNLRPFLESWFGREITDREAEEGIDLEDVCLSIPALLQVVHVESQGKVYANIKTVMPLPDGYPAVTVEGYTRKTDRQERDDRDSEVPF